MANRIAKIEFPAVKSILLFSALLFLQVGCNPLGKSSMDDSGSSGGGSSSGSSSSTPTAATASLSISDGATYDYGTVSNGSTSAKSFTLSNSGSVAATLGTISTGGLGLAAPYTLTGGTCVTGATVAANTGSCTLIVTFAPTVAGASNATISVSYNNGSATVSATRAITGTGANTAPGAFAISSASSAGTTSVALNWAAASGATSYTVKYGTVSGAYPTTFSAAATSPTVVTGLTSGTLYYFMVVAVNGVGSTDATAEVSATPAPLSNDGLIGYWTFDTASISGTTASGVTGYTLDGATSTSGTLGGSTTPPTSVAGHSGESLSFDGTKYVLFNNVMNPTAGITMAAWVKTTATRGQAIISKDGNTTDACSSNAAQAYFLHLNADGTVSCWLNRYDGSDSVINGRTAINDGAWHLVVCSAQNSASSNNWHVYLDGSTTPDVSGTIARNGSNNIIATTTDVLTVGAGFRGTNGCGISPTTFNFDGSIDEVRIYNKGISASEARLLYTSAPDLTPKRTTMNVNAQLTFSTSGGIAPLTYSVTGGGSISAAGVFTAPSSAGTSTVTVTGADGSTSTATVSVISAATPSIFNKGRLFNLDATLATGSAAPTAGCATTTSWMDLVVNLSGTLTNFAACGATSGWNGDGTTTPYRLTLDGTNDYLTFPNSTAFNVTSDFTLDTWVYPTSLAARSTIFSTMTNGTAGSFTFEVGIGNGGTDRVSFTTPGVWNADTGNNAVTANAWNHVVYTRSSGSNQKVYVNGTEKALVTNNPVSVATNTSAKILGATASGGQHFPGSIASFNIYDSALSATAVARNCNALVSRFSSASCTTYSAPTKLVLSGPTSLIKDYCQAITVYAKDASDNLSEVTADKTISISESGGATLYNNSTCTTSATSVTMSADTSSTTFYAKGTVAAVTFHLSASDAGAELTSATVLDLLVEESPVPGIAGLLGWYKADSINQANGSAVSSWADLSGNNNHATQATVAAQPTYATSAVGGQPAVRFADADGTEDSLGFTTAFTTIRTALFVVQHSDGSQEYPFIIGDGGGSPFHGGGGGALFYYAFANTRAKNNGVDTPPLSFAKSTSPQLIAITLSADAASTSFISKGNVGGRFWDGWISEIVLYDNSAITENGVKSIERYLAAKYSISLPGGY